MKKIFFCLIFASALILAQDAGKSGLSFLKFGFGARNIAMGDAGNAISDDVTSLFYNPAKLSLNRQSEIILMHNEWIQDVRSEVLGARTIIFGLPFALGFNVTSVSGIEVRTQPGPVQTTFNANYFYGSLSTGFNVSENFSAGATLKYLYEGLFQDEATGWAADLGILYKLPVDGLIASASVRNLGGMNKLRAEETKLPSEVRIGASYEQILSDDFSGIVGADVQKYFESTTHFNIGGEITYNSILSLRAGYQTGFETRGFTGGVGLKWGSLSFDYAFLPFSLGIGNANLLSVTFTF